MLNVTSLFSGAGGFDLGLERSGMKIAAQVEIDKWCQGVLRNHWPDTPKWNDISNVTGSDLPHSEVIAFGSPCQDLSVAGTRSGLDGSKSNLFFEAIRIIKELQDEQKHPTWVIWENVRGALQSNRGRDFGKVLDTMAECGAVRIEWRCLDAKYFGVAQRRRRVFVVACFNPGGTGGQEIFPFPESLRGHSEKSKKKKSQSSSEGLPSSGKGLVAETGIVTSLAASFGGAGVDAQHAQNGWLVPVYSFDSNFGNHSYVFENECSTIKIGSKTASPPAIVEPNAIRRLTPIECERLMSWPDDWTKYSDNGILNSDSQRYRMCGNGVVSNVAQWVGEQINSLDIPIVS